MVLKSLKPTSIILIKYFENSIKILCVPSNMFSETYFDALTNSWVVCTGTVLCTKVNQTLAKVWRLESFA